MLAHCAVKVKGVFGAYVIDAGGGSMLLRCVMVLISMFLFTMLADAQLYKWKDENGATYFSDNPPVEDEVRVSTINPENIGGSVSAVKNDGVGLVKNRVELYSTSWCIYCKKARAFFHKNKVRFTDYDIEKNAAAALKKKRLDSQRGVPFALINGVKIHGYIESEYVKALNIK